MVQAGVVCAQGRGKHKFRSFDSAEERFAQDDCFVLVAQDDGFVLVAEDDRMCLVAQDDCLSLGAQSDCLCLVAQDDQSNFLLKI
jgi:hypothetical protein